MGRLGAIYLTWGTHISYQPPNAQNEPTGQLTSRSALTFHTPYAMASIPRKVIAVFVCHFAGRDHQPPAVPFDRVGTQVQNGRKRSSVYRPAGVQTCFGYG